MLKGHILLIGCGNMGKALLAGWLRAKEVADDFRISIVDLQEVSVDSPSRPVVWYPNIDSMPKDDAPDIIILAIKPHHLLNVAKECGETFSTHPLYLSVAAGVTMQDISQAVGRRAKIVRVMPNTPALIARGMTSLVGNSAVTSRQRDAVTALFDAVGKTLWLKDESQMHAATALAGSSPAYLYYFAECMVNSGVKAGMKEEDALMLALNSLEGAATLARLSDSPLTELRRQVTSPGGTTEAAINAFKKDDRLPNVVQDAFDACIARSKELSESKS